MQQRNIFRGTKGWHVAYESAVRFRHMRNTKEVQRRVQILAFFEKHGTDATKDAFGASRRTLFRWKKALASSQGKIQSLDPKSTAPRQRRKRVYKDGYLKQVIELRTAHPRLGKKKLAVLLGVSESYAGRTLNDLKERGLLPAGKKVSLHGKTGRTFVHAPVYRKKLRRHAKRGMELDTVVRYVDGQKRYILTAIDVQRRFAFAGAYSTHSSRAAADFLSKLFLVCPFPIEELQTDNGSEFAKEFAHVCVRMEITHFHTYPRAPKMNAHIERFNRTLSEDFIARRRNLLRDDIHAFNEELVSWLLWYNCERPHQSLSMMSPMQYIVSTLSDAECQRCWTSTCSVL